MELRIYWGIIIRRIWIIALVVGIVALYAGYQSYELFKTPGALKSYQSDVLIHIGLQGNTLPANHSYADYISASEYLADEFTTGPILTSKEFTTQIAQQIQTDLPEVKQHFPEQNLGNITDPHAIGSALTATRIHSLVTLSASWNTPAGAWAIANAAGKVCAASISTYLGYMISNSAAAQKPGGLPIASAQQINAVSEPVTVSGPAATKPLLLLALLVVALVIGLALAFLIEYLDERIRGRDELEDVLQLPVYGEIPRAPLPGKQRTSTPSLT